MTDGYANRRLSRYYLRFCETAREAHRKYAASPHIEIHRPTTMANDLNDLWFSELVNGFDQIDGIAPVFDLRRNLRFIKIPGRIPIHLWVKKTDIGYHSSNVQTEHARRLLESGQTEMFPSAVILTLGYLLNADRTGINRVSITPPFSGKLKPEWAIDLRLLPNVRGMAVVGSESVEVKITRFSQRRLDA